MPSFKTKKFTKIEQKKSPLDYLNNKRMVPSAGKPIVSGAVDPFSQDDVDQVVDQADVLNRREENVPVGGHRFPRTPYRFVATW